MSLAAGVICWPIIDVASVNWMALVPHYPAVALKYHYGVFRSFLCGVRSVFVADTTHTTIGLLLKKTKTIMMVMTPTTTPTPTITFSPVLSSPDDSSESVTVIVTMRDFADVIKAAGVMDLVNDVVNVNTKGGLVDCLVKFN